MLLRTDRRAGKAKPPHCEETSRDEGNEIHTKNRAERPTDDDAKRRDGSSCGAPTDNDNGHGHGNGAASVYLNLVNPLTSHPIGFCRVILPRPRPSEFHALSSDVVGRGAVPVPEVPVGTGPASMAALTKS